MRIAVCFYGLVGSVSNKNGEGVELNPDIAHSYFLANVLNHNENIDVFIHSTSTGKKEDLIRLYNPKAFKFEVQREFPEIFSHKWLYGTLLNRFKLSLLRFFRRSKYIKLKTSMENDAFRAYSRWFSVRESISLLRQYEEQNEFKYDYVLSTRLDLAFFTPLVFNHYDPKFFYASHWNDAPQNGSSNANAENHNVGSGFLDLWFFSNSDTMYHFSKLFDKIDKYPVSPHISSYQHAVSINSDIRYTLFRWTDHELVRRRLFNSEK